MTLPLISKNFLIILVGLPASGKTTFAFELKKELEELFKKFIVKVVDPDKIRDLISPDEFEYNKEQIVRKRNLDAIKKALEEDFIVISDDLNYYISMRHDLKKIADDLGLQSFVIYISTPLKTCLKWNKNRGTTIPNEVLININKKLDSFNRYSWDFPIATYNLYQVRDLSESIKNACNLINSRLNIGIEKAEYKKQPSNKNNEKLDKITREIVGNLLREPQFYSLKNQIIKLRKIFVKDQLKKSLNELEIEKSFKQYIENSLNCKIK